MLGQMQSASRHGDIMKNMQHEWYTMIVYLLYLWGLMRGFKRLRAQREGSRSSLASGLLDFTLRLHAAERFEYCSFPANPMSCEC